MAIQGLQRRERRHKLQIYLDILSAIQEEATYETGAKPTRIQHLSNMAYDKLQLYLDELEAKNMIYRKDKLSLTEQGREVLIESQRVKALIERLGLQ